MAVKKKTRVTKSLWWVVCIEMDVILGPYKTEADAQDGAKRYAERYVDTDWVTMILQSRNDGTSWATLIDGQGSIILEIAASIEQIAEFNKYIRPYIDGGGAARAPRQ